MDIAIHARKKNDERDWSFELWEQLCGELRNRDLVPHAVGTHSDYCPEDAVDARGVSLRALAERFADFEFILGGSSGVMHFAAHCNLPVIVWGDPAFPVPEFGTSREVYSFYWNPFTTPTLYIGSGWKPRIEHILGAVDLYFQMPQAMKYRSAAYLKRKVAQLQAAGKKIALANGVFDMLHEGHLSCIQFAKEHCDILIVAINSDESTRRLKGPGRPIWNEARRLAALSELDEVDYLMVFDEDWPEDIINAVNPDMLVKGESYRGAEIAGGSGRQVLFAPEVPGVSTTKLVTEPGLVSVAKIPSKEGADVSN